jgi:hypothetical protein
MLEE